MDNPTLLRLFRESQPDYGTTARRILQSGTSLLCFSFHSESDIGEVYVVLELRALLLGPLFRQGQQPGSFVSGFRAVGVNNLHSSFRKRV